MNKLTTLETSSGRIEISVREAEGWDDGYQAAQENHRRLAEALASVYNVKE